jgi:aspartyl/asparaginyl beta-hydroxylase (cupin superfamily)
MSGMSTPDRALLARTGTEALRRGDARAARASFEQLVESGEADAGVYLALAQACRGLGDIKATHAAVDRALALEPRHLRALVMKGDCLAEEGDGRSASTFYMAAVQSAPPPQQMPAEIRAEIARAEAMCRRYAQEFESFLMERITQAGFVPGGSSTRFAHALDLLFGRRHVYLQQPRYFYFPELPPIQFYDRAHFPWLGSVEAATEAIRAELLEVMKDDGAFTPYVESNPGRPARRDPLVGNPSWSAFYLVKNGEVVRKNAIRCPRTLEALDRVPLSRVKNRSPSILFSQLKPGAHIPPHNGFVNTRLICHLPLIVPGKCTFRVGNEQRDWVEGHAWVFDDTIEHEAWNRSDKTRVVLLFDVWRPELDDQERRLVSAMFEAIDAHRGAQQSWDM